MQPVVLDRGGGVTVRPPVGGALTFKVRGRESDGSMTVFESVVGPGEGPPLHIHDAQDESMYVIEGELRFELGDETHHMPTGSFVFVPRGTAHRWQIIGDVPGRLLVFFSPSGIERFFERVDGQGIEAFTEFGPDGGMTIVGPPLPRGT